MNSQDARDIVKKMMSRKAPPFADNVRMGWDAVCYEMEKTFKGTRPRLTSFEIHHIIETARAVYLKSLAQEKPIADAITLALKSVSISK